MSELKTVTEKLQPKSAGAFKKFMRWFFIIVILVVGAFVYWKYYYTFSSGLQGGKMQKISYKGNVFKTWEGYLLISLTTTDNSISLSTKEFNFSVTSDSIAHACIGKL